MMTRAIVLAAMVSFAAGVDESTKVQPEGMGQFVGLKMTQEQSVRDPGTGGRDGDSGQNSATQELDLGLGTGILYNEMPAWVDLDESRFVDVPQWMWGYTTLLPSSQTSDDKVVYWSCSPQVISQSTYCDIYAFAYPCLTCPGFDHGDFMHKMAALGWEMFRCGPRVRIVNGGKHHALVGFTRRIDENTSYRLKMTAPLTEFTMYAINHYGSRTACSQYETLETCTADDVANKCVWEAGECVFNRCSTGAGPGQDLPCTEHCITADLDTPQPEVAVL